MTDWISILAPANDWRTAYPIVGAEVRKALKGIPQSAPIRVGALVRLLWPGKTPREATGKAAHARLYQALKALASHDCADCVIRGEPVPSRWGGPIRRNLWWEGTGTAPKLITTVPLKTPAWEQEDMLKKQAFTVYQANLIASGMDKMKAGQLALDRFPPESWNEPFESELEDLYAPEADDWTV